MMKKHLVEGVVPVLVELKRSLQEARHPLLGEVMACLGALLKDYKSEIEDILVADKQVGGWVEECVEQGGGGGGLVS